MSDGLVADPESSAAVCAELTDEATPVEPQTISLRQLLGDVMVYGLASIADRAIGFLLLPIMTAILMPADYGIMSLFTTTAHVLFIFCSLGVHQGFFRYYTEAQDSESQLQVLNTSLVLAIGYWALLLPIFILFREQLNQLIFGIDGSALTMALAAAMLIQVLDSVASNRLQADGRRWTYCLVVLTSSIILRTTAIVLVLQGMGAWGWVLSDTLGRLVAVVLLVVVAMPDASFKPNRAMLRPIASYGVLLVPALMSYYIMIVADKYLIRALSENPLEEVGFYSVGERIAGAMQLVNLAFIFGWQRFAFRNMHHEEGPQIIAKGMLWFAMGGGFFALALAMLGDDLTRMLIAKAFEPGIVVIAPLTVAALAGGLASIAEIGLHKQKLPLHISYLNGAAAVLNVLLNIWAIPRWGIAGAAYATMVCQFLRVLVIWRAANAVFPLPFEYARFLAAGCLFLAVYGLGQVWAPSTIGTITVVQTLLVLATPLLLWACGIITPDEKAAARQLLRTLRTAKL
jgi:O-antigen/teichoic acid export membrane protein